MPNTTVLMGSGFSPLQALQLDTTPASLAATGATAAAAATINNRMTIVTAATSTAAAVIFSTAAQPGAVHYVVNSISSAVTATIFCPVSGAMNGTSNGSLLLTTGQSAIFILTTAGTSVGSWYSIKTA
jgi:hypothetical protein